MTFILTALTRHEVVQVSDRRFTYTRPDGSVSSRNDEKNKALLFCGRLLFGFAGRGDLGYQRRSDLWLAKTICDVLSENHGADQGQLLEGIAERCTDLFVRAYRGERHSFVAAGWANFGPSDDERGVDNFTPYLAAISNYHDDSGRERDQVQEKFTVWVRPLLPEEGGFVWGTPGHLSAEEYSLLSKRLSHADQHRSPQMIAEYMAGQLKEVAARDRGVGEGLMISALPRNSLGNADGIMAVAGAPDLENQSFLYVPPSGDTTVQLGPVTTCGGGITAGFEVKPLPEDWKPPKPAAELPDDPPGSVRRWYVTAIDGSGTDGDPYRARTHELGGSGPIEGGSDGHATHHRTLILISASDHSDLLDDPEIEPIADLADLDRPVDELPPERLEWIRRIAETHRVASGGRVRDVLRAVGAQYQAGFDETNFWVR